MRQYKPPDRTSPHAGDTPPSKPTYFRARLYSLSTPSGDREIGRPLHGVERTNFFPSNAVERTYESATRTAGAPLAGVLPTPSYRSSALFRHDSFAPPQLPPSPQPHSASSYAQPSSATRLQSRRATSDSAIQPPQWPPAGLPSSLTTPSTAPKKKLAKGEGSVEKRRGDFLGQHFNLDHTSSSSSARSPLRTGPPVRSYHQKNVGLGAPSGIAAHKVEAASPIGNERRRQEGKIDSPLPSPLHPIPALKPPTFPVTPVSRRGVKLREGEGLSAGEAKTKSIEGVKRWAESAQGSYLYRHRVRAKHSRESSRSPHRSRSSTAKHQRHCEQEHRTNKGAQICASEKAVQNLKKTEPKKECSGAQSVGSAVFHSSAALVGLRISSEQEKKDLEAHGASTGGTTTPSHREKIQSPFDEKMRREQSAISTFDAMLAVFCAPACREYRQLPRPSPEWGDPHASWPYAEPDGIDDSFHAEMQALLTSRLLDGADSPTADERGLWRTKAELQQSTREHAALDQEALAPNAATLRPLFEALLSAAAEVQGELEATAEKRKEAQFVEEDRWKRIRKIEAKEISAS